MILFVCYVPRAVCKNSIDMCPCHAAAAGAKIYVVLHIQNASIFPLKWSNLKFEREKNVIEEKRGGKLF